MTSTHSGIAHQPRGQTTIEYLPLEEVRVKAWVVDVSSRTDLMQTFYNPSNEPTGRAKYVFPLPANAAVCAFDLELQDGSIIVGEVKEKEEAAGEFARAAEQGKVAALVEYVTNDIFTISVGSIPATTRVTAHLTFVMDLLDEGLRDHVRLQLPMHIAERYGTPPVTMLDAATADSRTRLHISVDIQTSNVIYNIHSPTHRISRRRYKGRSDQISQRRMSAVFKSAGFLDSDFVVTIHAEGLDQPRCFAEVLDARRNVDSDGEGSTIAMQLTLVPKLLGHKVLSQEYIFVIDRSGSMHNDPIETAKRTLTTLLRLLPANETTFNIFSFGSVVQTLWRHSRALDKASLTEAISHVVGMGADLGGTEIPAALQAAFNSRGLDRPAVVFLLTDGSIHGNEELNAWVANAVRDSPVRLFVLGIGAQVSSDVCSSLARHGNGECLFAVSTEDICGKCARLLNAGRSRNIEYIDINWGYNTSNSPPTSSTPTALALPPSIPALAPPPPIQQAPHALTRKSFFSGIRFTVFVITSLKTVPTSVTLKTKVEGCNEPQESTVPITKVKPFRNALEDSLVPMVHTLAARKLIMELADKVAPPPSPAPEDALLASEADLRRAGIVRLGLTYQLVSEHTSFVAVQKGDELKGIRGRRNGSLAWAKSRLRQTRPHTQKDSPADAPSLLDDLINGMSSFLGSVLNFFTGSVVSTSMNATSSSRSHHQRLPGTYAGSDSGSAKTSMGSVRRQSNPRPTRSRSPSNSSARTFSTLSSLEGSSGTCSSCWTPSRPSSPAPASVDPPERAPSPDFHKDASIPDQPRVRARVMVPVPPQVYDLFQQMDVDGSFKVSPLITQVVGDAVLGKADELGVDRSIWTTVVVVAYMTQHLQGEPYLLELVSEKAREFVEAALTRVGGVKSFDQMVREANAFLGAAA